MKRSSSPSSSSPISSQAELDWRKRLRLCARQRACWDVCVCWKVFPLSVFLALSFSKHTSQSLPPLLSYINDIAAVFCFIRLPFGRSQSVTGCPAVWNDLLIFSFPFLLPFPPQFVHLLLRGVSGGGRHESEGTSLFAP